MAIRTANLKSLSIIRVVGFTVWQFQVPVWVFFYIINLIKTTDTIHHTSFKKEIRSADRIWISFLSIVVCQIVTAVSCSSSNQPRKTQLTTKQTLRNDLSCSAAIFHKLHQLKRPRDIWLYPINSLPPDKVSELDNLIGRKSSSFAYLHYQLDDASVVTRANRLLSNDCVYSNHTVSVVVSSPKAHRLGNKVALSKWPK